MLDAAPPATVSSIYPGDVDQQLFLISQKILPSIDIDNCMRVKHSCFVLIKKIIKIALSHVSFAGHVSVFVCRISAFQQRQ